MLPYNHEKQILKINLRSFAMQQTMKKVKFIISILSSAIIVIYLILWTLQTLNIIPSFSAFNDDEQFSTDNFPPMTP